MPINWKSVSQTSNLVLRIPLGLTLVMIGVSAYRDFAPFVELHAFIRVGVCA